MWDEKVITLKFRDKQTGRLGKRTGLLSGNFGYASRTAEEKDRIALTSNKTIMLFIFGMIEWVDFVETPVVTLGRYDPHMKSPHLLDLKNYGAVERGVSRSHCQLEVKDGQLTLTDLNSSNGTYVSGNRLQPHQPYILKKGEEIALGRLVIQVMT